MQQQRPSSNLKKFKKTKQKLKNKTKNYSTCIAAPTCDAVIILCNLLPSQDAVSCGFAHTAVSSFTSLTDEYPLRLGLGVLSLRKPSRNASRAILHVTAIPCDYDRVSRLYKQTVSTVCWQALFCLEHPLLFPSLLSSSSSLASHQPDRCPSRVSPSLTTWAQCCCLGLGSPQGLVVYWWPEGGAQHKFAEWKLCGPPCMAGTQEPEH